MRTRNSFSQCAHLQMLVPISEATKSGEICAEWRFMHLSPTMSIVGYESSVFKMQEEGNDEGRLLIGFSYSSSQAQRNSALVFSTPAFKLIVEIKEVHPADNCKTGKLFNQNTFTVALGKKAS